MFDVVERALTDERLLLLVDGVDEWLSEDAANFALGAIETFIGHHGAAVFMSSRPYAVERLPFALDWRRADLAPLNAEQQRRVAVQYLMPPDSGNILSNDGLGDLAGAELHATSWSKSNVDPFLAQLAGVRELDDFARNPLLLALLAVSWRGEPLPPRRFDLYRLIVRMLVETHPKMRARASRATTSALTTAEFLTLFEAVAYRIKSGDVPQPMPLIAMQRLIVDVLVDPDVLGFDGVQAQRMASAALAMAEDEIGLVVPAGAGHVGFVHRVIFDHLAGQHLARLEPKVQSQVFRSMHADSAWTDVLLAALSAEASPHRVGALLDEVLDAGTEAASARDWPAERLLRESAWRFAAEVLAAGVQLVPRKAGVLLDGLVTEVDEAISTTYRAALVTSLVGASVVPAHWRRLAPTFRRWLDATRPNPAGAMEVLAHVRVPDSDAAKLLIHGIRHGDGAVRESAARAFAHRFGTPRGSADHPLLDLAVTKESAGEATLSEVIESGPNVTAQAAALMALVEGWPSSAQAQAQVDWARRQPRTDLRTVALWAVGQASSDVSLRDVLEPAEVEWLLDDVYEERYRWDQDWSGARSVLVERLVSEANEQEQQAIAEHVLETLRGKVKPRGVVFDAARVILRRG